jgi:hypothetical protein
MLWKNINVDYPHFSKLEADAGESPTGKPEIR